MTRIITDPETGSYKLFLTSANIEPRRVNPVADIVIIANETTLSQHYVMLAKSLTKVARDDKDIRKLWHVVAKELMYLSVVVEKHLSQYNVYTAKSLAIVADGYWDCVANCIVDNLWQYVLEYCWEPCLPCIAGPTKLTCLPCVGCLAGVAGGTVIGCLVSCLI